MKAILRSGFLALAIIALAVPAHAGPYEDASAAYVDGDYATSLRLLRPLAEQDHAKAQADLGSMYYYGRGVPQDYTEAVKWYRMAAEQGSETGQTFLGIMYLYGQGVPQDIVSAYMWFDLILAKSRQEYARQDRDEVAKKMTPDQIAEAERMAREWLAKHQQ